MPRRILNQDCIPYQTYIVYVILDKVFSYCDLVSSLYARKHQIKLCRCRCETFSVNLNREFYCFPSETFSILLPSYKEEVMSTGGGCYAM